MKKSQDSIHGGGIFFGSKHHLIPELFYILEDAIFIGRRSIYWIGTIVLTLHSRRFPLERDDIGIATYLRVVAQIQELQPVLQISSLTRTSRTSPPGRGGYASKKSIN